MAREWRYATLKAECSSVRQSIAEAGKTGVEAFEAQYLRTFCTRFRFSLSSFATIIGRGLASMRARERATSPGFAVRVEVFLSAARWFVVGTEAQADECSCGSFVSCWNDENLVHATALFAIRRRLGSRISGERTRTGPGTGGCAG